MLNGVRMRALRKIHPLTARDHWSDGNIPSLISVEPESAEDRPICSSGRQTNVRGFSYDDTVEAWTP